MLINFELNKMWQNEVRYKTYLDIGCHCLCYCHCYAYRISGNFCKIVFDRFIEILFVNLFLNSFFILLEDLVSRNDNVENKSTIAWIFQMETAWEAIFRRIKTQKWPRKTTESQTFNKCKATCIWCSSCAK